jgi:hypothetical protein
MLREFVLAIGIPLLLLLLAVLVMEHWRDQLPVWLLRLAERPSWLWNTCIGLIIGLSLQRWLLQRLGSGNGQLLVVTRCDGGDCRLDLGRDLTNPWPAGGGQHQDRDAAASQVLLVAEVGVGGDQELVALLLRQANQVPVGDGGPAQLIGSGDDMAVQ